MSRNRKRIVGIAGIALAFVVVGLGPFLGPPVIDGVRIARAKTRLLRNTDHQALLGACRELSRRQMNGELDSKEPLESSPQLPEIIRALRPDFVNVDWDGRVNIELGNKWYPLGVWAFPESQKKPEIGYGDRKLLDGLWYYEDGYEWHPDEYNKDIDALLSKNKKLKSMNAAPGPHP